MTATTSDENILWEYVQQESDALLLDIQEKVENDGFAKAARGDSDCVATMIMAAANLKMLVLMAEKGNLSLPGAFMAATTTQVELLKLYVLEQFRQGT